MPIYSYQFLNKEQKTRSAMMQADSLESAKAILRKRAMKIISVEEEKFHEKKIYLTPQEVLFFTRDIKELLRAKLTLYEALSSVEEKYRGEKKHKFFLKMCEDLKKGISFSSILEGLPTSFSKIYIQMVEVAEESGSLERIFKELTIMLEKQDKMKKQLRSAAIYPVFLGIFSCFMLFGLFFYLIPSMKELFEDRKLHPVTEIILATSDFLIEYQSIVLIFLFIIISSFIGLFRAKKTKTLFINCLIRLPLIKTIFLDALFVRFTRTMAILLSSGVEIVKALSLAKKTMGHETYVDVITKVEQGLIEGEGFATLLGRSPLVPKLMVQMLHTAEKTGAVPEMLGNIAEIYENRLEKTMSQISHLMQPIFLTFMGIIVGVILLAILLPLTDVTTFL